MSVEFSNKIWPYAKEMCSKAYLWTPYNKLVFPTGVDYKWINQFEKELIDVNTLSTMILKSGTRSPRSHHCYLASKAAMSNYYILEKLYRTKNSRLYSISNNITDVKLASHIYKDVGIICGRYSELFLDVD